MIQIAVAATEDATGTSATITIAKKASRVDAKAMDIRTATEIATVDIITIETVEVEAETEAVEALAMNKSDEQAKVCRNCHLRVRKMHIAGICTVVNLHLYS
jgi:hypothetical protein